MVVTDTIADMLTRIRNANQMRYQEVSVPASNIKCELARILKDEGFIEDYKILKDDVQGTILLTLKYVDLLFYTELMNGNYSRFKKKITDDVNPIANNYSKLLSIKIGNQKDFDFLCNRLSSSLDKSFMNISELNIERYPHDNDYEMRKSIAKELYSYIPQIEPNITYKQTLERIIN